MTPYIPGMDDILDSMEKFETAKEVGKGAIALRQSTTLVIDGVEVDADKDRMCDAATYQAAQTQNSLFQDVFKQRPDQPRGTGGNVRRRRGQTRYERRQLTGPITQYRRVIGGFARNERSPGIP